MPKPKQPLRSSVMRPLAVTLVMIVLALGSAAAQSPPGSAGAKAASKCQQTIAKVNAKFLAQRLKRLAACGNAVLSCVQVQPGVPACVGKATAKCRKQLGAPDVPDTLAAKLEAAVLKACGALPVADLLTGLGFASSRPACAEVGVDTLDDAGDVAVCLRRLHANVAEQAFGVELPRAAELTAQGGINALVVPELQVFSGCGQCSTPPAGTGKVVAGCGAAIAKSGAAFIAKARSGADKCATAFVNCAQQKPGDLACLAKAKGTCQKIPADLAKARAKVLAALQKKCGGLPFGALQAPSGINLAALVCECQQVGVEIASIDDYATCLTRQHECRVAALLPTVVPGFEALLAGQGLGIEDVLCPPSSSLLTLERLGVRLVSPFGSISKFVRSAVPSSLTTALAPRSTRGSAPRVFRLFRSSCGPGPGRTCGVRFGILRKSPFSLQRSAPRGAAPATLVLGVRRGDGEFVADHFELDLPDTSTDIEQQLDIEYPPDLATCNFELALSVMEDGEVSSYTGVEQQPHPIPTNDQCVDAREITTASFSDVVDTTEATLSGGDFTPLCAFLGISKTVWYRFTAPANGVISADTFGSDYDTVLAVYTGACSDPAEQTCNNDSDGTLQSKVAVPVIGGTTYLIQVGHADDPGPPSTLHFRFGFDAGGEPAKLSKPALSLVELNSAFCSGLNGSTFRFEADFVDPDGDVLNGLAFVNVSVVFSPSGSNAVFSLFAEVSGDGFSGRVGFDFCLRFSADTSAEVGVTLIDLAGIASNDASVKINHPPGAN